MVGSPVLGTSVDDSSVVKLVLAAYVEGNLVVVPSVLSSKVVDP